MYGIRRPIRLLSQLRLTKKTQEQGQWLHGQRLQVNHVEDMRLEEWVILLTRALGYGHEAMVFGRLLKHPPLSCHSIR